MLMNKIFELFQVVYGNSLELNKLERDDDGINFVSRTATNNGVSAKVKRLSEIEPFNSNIITVALGGSVLATFLQPEPFYTSYHIYCLTPLFNLSLNELMFYCVCIRANKFRYNYGRQANRTLRDLLVPSISEIPDWVSNIQNIGYESLIIPLVSTPIKFDPTNWKSFSFDELFEIKKGKRLTKSNMKPGNTPFIGSTDSNNGVTNYINQKANHEGNTITVTYNGSVAEAFYQPIPYFACDDVNVLYPKFELNPYIGLFITTVIRKEKFRFNYGRKWHVDRMKTSIIKLPIMPDGNLDLEFMEKYIKGLPFSSAI
ncbi:MAG: restriction endonuclease subunit S [Candidatus Atribacteria bacterium]|nr:restriction endonuclease subunit S [Candidatus Atribacteria bacterium]